LFEKKLEKICDFIILFYAPLTIRKKRAIDGIKEMKKNCDTLLVIPNETLLEITDENTTIPESFKLADSVLHQATKGISDLINKPGIYKELCEKQFIKK